jgi:hypothetical protein
MGRVPPRARPAAVGVVFLVRTVFRKRFFEARDLALRFILGDSVDFLDATGQRLASAFDDVQVIVRQLAPLLPDFSRKLLPIPFDAIPVHGSAP